MYPLRILAKINVAVRGMKAMLDSNGEYPNPFCK